MSQLHGYPTLSKTMEETTNTDTSTNCNFDEEMSKLCNNLVGNTFITYGMKSSV